MTATWRERLGLPRTEGRGRLLWASAIDSTGSGLFIPFQLVYFAQTTPQSLATVGAALTVAALLALPLPALIGPLVDRVGPRRVVAAGNVVSAVGFIGYLLADRVWSVVLVALLTNAGVAAFWTSSGALVALAADEGERSRWFGLIRALRNAGIGLGGLLAAAVLAALGTSGLHLLVAGDAVSYVVAGLLTWSWRPDRPQTTVHHVDDSAPVGFRGVLRDRPFTALVGVHVLLVLATVLPTILLAVYVTRSLHGPSWAAAVLLALNTGIIALGQTTLTRLVEHRDRVWMLAAGFVLYGASFVVFGSLAVLPSAALLVGLALAMTVFTFGEMAESVAVSDLVVSMSPPHLRGRYQAVYQLSWSLGGAVAPLTYAWLLEQGAGWPWAAGAIGCAVGVVGLVALRPSVPAHARLGQDAGWNVSSNTRSRSRPADHAESGVDQ